MSNMVRKCEATYIKETLDCSSDTASCISLHIQTSQ